jgi:hypothetical protein
MHIPETVKTYGLIALVVIASFWFASRFIEPPPPDRIVLAAGSASGDYYRYANSYKNALAKEGITVEIIETAGSLENVDLLIAGKADVAFIQSGLETPESRENIETLASLYYEPLWIFSRENNLPEKDLQNLRNNKLAIGANGSGTNAIARQLLKLNKIAGKNTLVDLSGKEAVKALLKGRVDAAFFVARPESPYIRELLHEKTIRLLSFKRADGYTHLLPFLSKVQLSEGVIDMAADIPDSDVYLLSPVAQLTSRTGFNGALKTLLVDSSMKIHGNADIFSAKGQFPSLENVDFPIAEEAARYFKYGPNILQRFLPFWLADMIGRMVVMLIPLLGIMLPLIKIASPAYRWRIRSKIYKWYKSLKKTEETAMTGEADLKETLASLELIDAEVKKTQVPLSYADELYSLRLHIQMIKEHLQKNK